MRSSLPLSPLWSRSRPSTPSATACTTHSHSDSPTQGPPLPPRPPRPRPTSRPSSPPSPPHQLATHALGHTPLPRTGTLATRTPNTPTLDRRANPPSRPQGHDPPERRSRRFGPDPGPLCRRRRLRRCRQQVREQSHPRRSSHDRPPRLQGASPLPLSPHPSLPDSADPVPSHARRAPPAARQKR